MICLSCLLAIFFWRDCRNPLPVSLASAQTTGESDAWHFDGLRNLLFLAVVLGAVFIHRPAGLREAVLLAAATGSYLTTPRRVHLANEFQFRPLAEVAWLFVGIFLTMTPVLDYLEVHAPGLGIDTEAKFFWLTGGLSAVLDNAPTYLALLAAALGNQGLSLDAPGDPARFLVSHSHLLTAISLGAVFFGAVTYIGNGPNFMVKAIAEQSQAPVPGFFRYLWRYSLPVLLPIFILVSLLFFSPWRLF